MNTCQGNKLKIWFKFFIMDKSGVAMINDKVQDLLLCSYFVPLFFVIFVKLRAQIGKLCKVTS